MAYAKGHHPGTVWRKSDLQCHSPRDEFWEGMQGLPGGTEANEGGRKHWAQFFLNKCTTAGLTLIAITDHHDAIMAEYVVSASEGTPVEVFRGVEVTCRDNVQCIALFDPSCDADIPKRFIGKLDGILPSHATASTTCPTKPCDINLEKLFEIVQGDSIISEHCLLLPHFSDEDAHKSANQEGFAPRFSTLPCDGVYIERSFGRLDPGTKAKVFGKTDHWGRRRRAVIATGDNKSDSYERLGTHECWIKIGEHSIEGLRQALLADEARVAYAKPDEPTERIVELRVMSTLTGPDVFSITFNAGFNSLIGGRGAGKSAVIEYLRFGLARTVKDFGQEDVKIKQRDEKLIEETLSHGGYVEIILERGGTRENWRRTESEKDKIHVTTARGEAFALTLENARERFRARAFEQKGLSSTMTDGAGDQITGIAAAEEVDQRRRIENSILAAKREATTALQQTVSYWTKKQAHE